MNCDIMSAEFIGSLSQSVTINIPEDNYTAGSAELKCHLFAQSAGAACD
jgi:hypothetical protein